MAAAKPQQSSKMDAWFEFNDNKMPAPKVPVSQQESLRRVQVPVLASQYYTQQDWNDTELTPEARKAAAEKARLDDLNYVREHVAEERQKIEKLNRGVRARNGHGKNGGGSNHLIRMSAGRGIGRGWGQPDNSSNYSGKSVILFNPRGRGRGQPAQARAREANQQEPNTNSTRGSLTEISRSIYGRIPDERGSDVDVFVKYNFTNRRRDEPPEKFVIYGVREKILTHLADHQILTIEGFTGCGKTTQVPQYILDDAVQNGRGCCIAVTQPRRIAAISVANRVAYERQWNVGSIVGYQVGMDRRVSEDTRLTYMTTGVLLQLLIAKKTLREYSHIIIDEVHERDLETDLLLLVIKKIMVDEYDTRTRIILMSATLDREKFEGYFPLWETVENPRPKAETVVVDLPNRFPIKEIFLEDVAVMAGFEKFEMTGLEEPKVHPDVYEFATHIVEGLETSEAEEVRKSGTVNPKDGKRGAVLVFLPGLLEIESFMKILIDIKDVRASEGKSALDLLVLPLHSSISNEEQQRVFIPAKDNVRKIILATNIAESSITVPDIKYVIDFCLTKSLSCDPATNYTCLRLEWASKNQCIQRRGRCGRVSAGVVYKMVTRKFYETLQQEACPEMVRSSLESVVLQVKLLNMGSPKAVLALSADPPPVGKIKRAVCNLKEIGALTIMQKSGKYDSFDGNLTFVGRVLSRLPIDIRFGRLILLGHAFDCLEETVIIAAGLSVKSPFAYPFSRRLDAYLSKFAWSDNSFSDCVALLNTYLEWNRRSAEREFQSHQEEKAWARAHFVQLPSLREMKVLIAELYKRLKMCGIELMASANRRGSEEQLLLLKLVIAGAFYPNYFTRPKPNPRDYQKEIARELSGEDPNLSVLFQGFPMEQPGELYKRMIGNAVTYQTCIPQLHFNGSRVVVVFDSRGNYIGPISLAVYRAVKMRHLRLNVSFPTPSREEAYEMVMEKNRKLDSLTVDQCPPQVTMPALMDKSVEAVLTHFESPSEFFIVLKSKEEALQQIESMLKSPDMTLDNLRKEQCQPGQFCIANVGDKYHRARVDATKLDCETVFVYLLDQGFSVWIRRQKVFAIGHKLFKDGIGSIEALAIQCRLEGIRAAQRTGCVWCHEASDAFMRYCSKDQSNVKLEIYSIVKSVISCDIRHCGDEEGKDSLKQILLNKKYAEKCEESKDSDENNIIRDRLQTSRCMEERASYQAVEDRQNRPQFTPEKLLDGPDLKKEPQNQASLRGPFSPLEMHFNSLCNSAHLKQVITDGSSVNSVSLDQDHRNSVSRLMIAANVAVAQRSGSILARETTLMPPIPGLCAILAMLFCQKMELRVDEDYSTYTGLVSGLGMDPEEQPIYRENDMEIVFDTQIDETDVSMVNSIRSSLNAILSEGATNDDIRNLRTRMRTEAIKLLERERRSIEEVWPNEIHKWNELEKDRIIDTPVERDVDAVFPLHNQVRLDERPEGSELQPSNRNRLWNGDNAQG